MRPVVVVGDTLLDRDLEGTVERLCPDGPAPVLEEETVASRPGGAGLAALMAASDGRPVTLVTALSSDAGGSELATMLARSGVEVVDLGTAAATPEKVRLRSGGRTLLRLDRGGGPGPIEAPGRTAEQALEGSAAVLVADYGRGVAAQPVLRRMLQRQSAPIVWDPHPRGARPAAGAALVTPNRDELVTVITGLAGRGGDGAALGVVGARAREAKQHWQAMAVSVTLGREGALLVEEDERPPRMVPAPSVSAGDPCGAGDRFASAAACLLAEGASAFEAVEGAVDAASSFVAAGGAAGPRVAAPPLRERGAGGSGTARQVCAEVRASGGTVVAAGGCFDLLHAGHVALLQASRRLGDCLVVCLNSDGSVRRLKGPGRPLVPEHDRIAVLMALGCVDAVAVFDSDTPAPLLEALRPHVFAKGGDYAEVPVPEEVVMGGWGGRIAILPFLDGRSTTGMLRRSHQSSHPRQRHMPR